MLRALLAALPPTSRLRQRTASFMEAVVGEAGSFAGAVDLFLHSQDRAYTVGQLFDWVSQPTDEEGSCGSK